MWMDRLPEVTPSSGLPQVLTGATATRASETSSSSAAIWASAVHTPWPYSTFPEKIVTFPAGENVEPGGEDRVGGQARDRGKAGLGHWVACRPECCEAALSTAATILPCVPHRQRLPFSASRTSCSVGAGLAASSAAAVTIIPEVQ